MMIFRPGQTEYGMFRPGAIITRPHGLSALANSLVGFWTFNETSGDPADSVGSNTLTDNNTVGTAVGVPYANSRLFNGTNEYFSHVDDAALQMGDIDYWMAAWVYPTSVPASNDVYQMIITKALNSITRFEYSLDLRRTTGQARFRFVIYNQTVTTPNEVLANTLGLPSNNTWYFLVAYHSATSNQLGISGNGGAYNTASTTIAPVTSASNFEVGRYAWSQNFYFPGRIGPIMLGKNYIPTATDVTFLYNSGAGRTLEAMRDY